MKNEELYRKISYLVIEALEGEKNKMYHLYDISKSLWNIRDITSVELLDYDTLHQLKYLKKSKEFTLLKYNKIRLHIFFKDKTVSIEKEGYGYLYQIDGELSEGLDDLITDLFVGIYKEGTYKVEENMIERYKLESLG